jgi:hypothetical protein
LTRSTRLKKRHQARKATRSMPISDYNSMRVRRRHRAAHTGIESPTQPRRINTLAGAARLTTRRLLLEF